jgi:hypothetical protein
MTTTQSAPTAPTAASSGGARTVDRLLEAITAGTGVPADVFASAVVLDATVPTWRFAARGRDDVARQFSGWFADPGSFTELERLPVESGEVVTYLLRWVERGVPHAAHQCHVLRFDVDGRIAHDAFFCGGRWDADRLEQMAAAEQV